MSAEIDDGGAAFPWVRQIRCHGVVEDTESMPGMSLRAWLAGQALAGALANPHACGDIDAIAREACMLADAVIAALKGGAE